MPQAQTDAYRRRGQGSNVAEWIKAGAVAVGAGSSLTKGAKTGDYDCILPQQLKSLLQRLKKLQAQHFKFSKR